MILRNAIRLAVGVVLALAILVLPVWTVAGRQGNSSTDPQAIVDQFWPPSMAEKADRESSGEEPLLRSSGFVVFDRFPDATPRTIIAAYSNGAASAIRVLRASDTRVYSLIHEPADLSLDGGPSCHVELVDVELDGVNEVFVSFERREGPGQDWIFAWDGTQLKNLGPATRHGDGPQESDLVAAELVDLDRTGPLYLTAAKDVTDSDTVLYRLSAGRFVFDRPLLLLGNLVRNDEGQPEKREIDMILPEDELGPYTLRILNGRRDGSQKVSGVGMVLNGLEILAPTQPVDSLTIPISLQQENTFQVTLTGKAPGQLLLWIEDERAAQRAARKPPQP